MQHRNNTSDTTRDSKVHWVDRLHGPAAAWLILAFSFVITVVAWKISNDYAESRAQERFNYQIAEAQNAITKRFINYEQVLMGGLGLFKASSNVTREEWRKYIDTLQIDTFFPGTLGVGYALWISPKQLSGHIKKIQAEGFPTFTVHPEGEREQYSSIVYIEPFTKRNIRAFGYDMYSNPIRREAMERARDTGETAISGRVTLVQESTSDVQHGFLIYVPQYRHEVHTVQERRDNLVGFVYSALRIGDLMHGILGVGLPELDFNIYDGTVQNNDALMYRSNPDAARTPVARPPTLRALQTLQIGGRTWSIEYHTNQRFDRATATSQPFIVAAGGIVIDFLLFYIILALGRLRTRAQTLADERMQKLQTQEIQFKALTDNASDAIITLDESGAITYFNKTAQDIFGYTEQEANQKPFLVLIAHSHHAHIADTMQGLVKQAAITQHSGRMEMEGITSNMLAIPLEVSISKIISDERLNYTVIVRDISERKRIERMKSEFISTVSHELRTPLAAISGSLSLVENGVLGPVSEKMLMLIKTASRNCIRLNTLVDDILDSEKMASGKMRFNISPCEIAPLIEHAIEINQPFAAKAGVSIEMIESIPTTLMVDPDRLIQVITNLLANAIKFSPAGNKVEVGVGEYARQIRIYVTDHGSGIPEAFRSKIFEKFAQADSTDARKYGGTGLGLSIVKFIVEQFNGSVDFTSVPNQKTTFYITLPSEEVARSRAS